MLVPTGFKHSNLSLDNSELSKLSALCILEEVNGPQTEADKLEFLTKIAMKLSYILV